MGDYTQVRLLSVSGVMLHAGPVMGGNHNMSVFHNLVKYARMSALIRRYSVQERIMLICTVYHG